MVDPSSASTLRDLPRDAVEADITLTCVSNEVGGSCVGNARWLGVPLDDLLGEAGVDPAADQIVGRSSTGTRAGSRSPRSTVATRSSRSA